LIIVADTNIIISGLLKPNNSSGNILKLILSGKIRLGLDSRIMDEYKDVLLREKFSFDRESVDYILDEIQADGISIIPEPLAVPLPDEDDIPFLEVAIAGNIKILVTGTKKHFPKKKYSKVKIYSPSEFIKEYGNLVDE
jgi:putative PIN family toxin of toxin-antitoxin system